MSEPTQDAGARPAAPTEIKSYRDVLKSMVGTVVTIANAESYEQVPLGFELTTGFYKGKVSAVAQDCVVLATEFERRGKNKGREPVKQFIPISRIKRISLMKSERVLHL